MEKSILDHRKAAITAKVCAQVYMFYEAAAIKVSKSANLAAVGLADISGDESVIGVIGWELGNEWTGYCDFKAMYYKAVTNFFLGLASEEVSKMGEAITYFAEASKDLLKANKIAKNFSSNYKNSNHSNIDNCLDFTNDVIDGKLDSAKKENEYIYHEKPPDFESLPPHKGNILDLNESRNYPLIQLSICVILKSLQEKISLLFSSILLFLYIAHVPFCAFYFKFTYSIIEKTQLGRARRAASISFFNNDGSHFVFSDDGQQLFSKTYKNRYNLTISEVKK